MLNWVVVLLSLISFAELPAGTLATCGNTGVTLTLNDLPPHSNLNIAFDFIKIDSWDGETFNVEVDGVSVYSSQYWYNVCNLDCSNWFGNVWVETIWPLALPAVAHSSSTVEIRFFDTLDQQVNDESWGIDNIVIDVDGVVVYSYDVEGGPGALAINPVLIGSHNVNGNNFLGPYSAQGCGSYTPPAPSPCYNGVQDPGEDGIDCGGPCAAACPSCTDGILNNEEEATDCGGPNCAACPSCSDGLSNQGEYDTDCGGPCSACPCDEPETSSCHHLAYCTGTASVSTLPPGFAAPTGSDGKFLCECGVGILGHGFGDDGCDTNGWNVRVVYQFRSTALTSAEEATLLGLLGVSCTRGSTDSCDHVHYTFHSGYATTQLGVNVLFPNTVLGKAAADAAASSFNSAAPAARRSYPSAVDPTVGARVYAWVSGTTSDPLQVLPAGMELKHVHFVSDCAVSGCWVLDVDFTVGHSDAVIAGRELGFNTFYLPYAVGSDALSYDFSYPLTVENSYEPAQFPCRVSDYAGGSVGTEETLCCFGTPYGSSTSLGGAPGAGFLGNYRPTEAFETYAAPLGASASCASTLPESVAPSYSTALGFFEKDEQFTGMGDSPGIASVTVVDSFVGMYSAVIMLDEVELRNKAGKLIGTVGVEHTIDTFLGYANFKPATTTEVLDSLASQVNIHLEKTSFFSVSTHGTNDYTFLEYVNLRLVAIYKEDADFSGADESGAGTVRTNSSVAAHYVQVTFTLGSKYEVNTNSGLIPLDSVRAGAGIFFDDATLEHKCEEWFGNNGHSFAGKSTFSSRLGQTCSPSATMCSSPDSIPDSFVSFNIPLGLDFYAPPSATLSNNIFVDMVISAVDTTAQMGMTTPNEGEAPWQMKTTLTASIPVVEGGVNIFCDGFTAKTDLKDVANADIVVGSASSREELSRLRIKKDIASTQLAPDAITQIDSDSIEAGLMTLVLKGNASYFLSNSGRSEVSIELEDVITIHIMENDGTGDDTSVSASVLNLITAAPDDNSDASGLNTDGYSLNGAFYFTIDRSAQRAHLEPSSNLTDICPFNPPRPSPGNMPLETCVTRRDVRYRDYPWRTGAKSTAMEICAATTPGTDGRDCPATTSAGWGSDESKFFVTIFGDNDYAKQLAVDYADVIASEYNLNGRYRRAYWINPGYEWTPTQTGGTPLFSISQKLYLFALITLDEGLATGDDGNSLPSAGPSLRRRMLLQTTTEEQLQDGQASVGAEAFQFESTPTSMMAKAFDVPQDLVATFRVTLQLTQAEACMGVNELQASLRDTLDDYLSHAASATHTVLVTHMSVDKAGVQCRRSIRSLLSSFSEATAEVTMMVVFKEDTAAAISVEKLATMAGVQSVENILVGSVDTSLPTTDLPSRGPSESEEGKEGSSSNVAIIAGAVGGAVAVALIVGAVFFLRRSKQPDVVQAVQTVTVNDLKAQL